MALIVVSTLLVKRWVLYTLPYPVAGGDYIKLSHGAASVSMHLNPAYGCRGGRDALIHLHMIHQQQDVEVMENEAYITTIIVSQWKLMASQLPQWILGKTTLHIPPINWQQRCSYSVWESNFFWGKKRLNQSANPKLIHCSFTNWPSTCEIRGSIKAPIA